MESVKRTFHWAAIIPLLIIAFRYFAGLSMKVDDWCYYNSGISVNTFYLSLSLGLFAFPHIIEAFFVILTKKSTVIELMIVVAIIGIIAAISVPNFKKARQGGFSVGGAKDINTFRLNVTDGKLPNETDITHEGLFYDYYFNTLSDSVSEATSSAIATGGVFTPVCSWAKLNDPNSEKLETFAAIGLRSSLDTNRIQRKKLNLVVVLDISGSMSSGFYSYYYDQFLSEKDQTRMQEDADNGKPKIQVATRAIVNMLDLLRPDDRFGMVLFSSGAEVAKPLRAVGDTNMEAIKRHILEIRPTGGTNMEAGIREGRSLFGGFEKADPEEYENRIIFLTDAMPNTGAVSRDDLFGLADFYAQERIYSTFIGVGIDFQTELVEFITKIRGANYYAIHSSWEFKKRLNKEFDYMVFPMLFNLRVTLQSEAFEIENIYGSPEADLGTRRIMLVNTLFPSPTEEDAVKGGVILLKLARKGPGEDLRLNVSYEDRRGGKFQTFVTSQAPAEDGEWCASPDVRKSVLLTRFVNLMKEWIRSERGPLEGRPENAKGGARNYWEHTSSPINISPGVLEKIMVFKNHFEEQSKIIKDSALDREGAILAQIITSSSKKANP